MPVPRIPGSGMYARAFPTGTLMVFQQTSAPPGWTKQTTHDDKSLRVVTGSASSGGATAFSSVFGSGKSTASHTLTSADIPAHTHGAGTLAFTYDSAGGGASTDVGQTTTSSASGNSKTIASGATASTGSGGGHSHTLSLDINYVDVIIAAKV